MNHHFREGDRIRLLDPQEWMKDYADLSKPLYIRSIVNDNEVWIYSEGNTEDEFHQFIKDIVPYSLSTKIGGEIL